MASSTILFTRSTFGMSMRGPISLRGSDDGPTLTFHSIHAEFAGNCRLQIAGGHGHAEVNSLTAVDDPMDIGWLE
jgi:hypothetical protein